MIEGDDIGRQGRRFGTDRTDLVAWGDSHTAPADDLQRRVERLEKRIQWLESIEHKRKKVYSEV